MTITFYALVLLFALFELFKAFHYDRIYLESRSYNHQRNKDAKNDYLKSHSGLCLIQLIDLTEYVLLFIGLFSDQWIGFLFILSLSLSRFKRLGAWAFLAGTLITVAVYAFILINKIYQLW